MSLCSSAMRCSSVARARYASCRGSCALCCTWHGLSCVRLAVGALRYDLARSWLFRVFFDPHTRNGNAIDAQHALGQCPLVGHVKPAAGRVVDSIRLCLCLVPERVSTPVVGYHNLHSASLP